MAILYAYIVVLSLKTTNRNFPILIKQTKFVATLAAHIKYCLIKNQ